MKFAHGTATHGFGLEQHGNELTGTHHGSFATRDLNGTLSGKDIVLRSSYTQQGVRLNFTFRGTVGGNGMEGKLSMGEYGMAEWKATRRAYRGTGGRRRS